MFNKKELQEIEEKLNKISDKIENQDSLLKEFNDNNNSNVKEIKTSIDSISQKQVTYFDEFDKNLSNFTELNLMYRKEFDNLASIKHQTTEKLLEKVEKELKQEIQKHLSNLDLEKQEFSKINKELDSLKQEIHKLMSISETIKTIDFELNNYIKKITEQDREKLRLMGQVDDLQKLIAKIRQGKHS